MLISINETCNALGHGRATIYRMIGAGKLDTLKLGRRRMVRRDAFEKLSQIIEFTLTRLARAALQAIRTTFPHFAANALIASEIAFGREVWARATNRMLGATRPRMIGSRATGPQRASSSDLMLVPAQLDRTAGQTGSPQPSCQRPNAPAPH